MGAWGGDCLVSSLLGLTASSPMLCLQPAEDFGTFFSAVIDAKVRVWAFLGGWSLGKEREEVWSSDLGDSALLL